MANKFYAVRKGREPGVYTVWSECQAQVIKFPGAEFKSFASEQEAKDFLEGKVGEKKETGPSISSIKKEMIEEGIKEKDIVVAYVDGSFDTPQNMYSYGAVILRDGKEIGMSGSGDDFEMASMRNVAGEILGAYAAMKYAQDEGIKHLVIVHDYAGISCWCTGAWKTNKEYTAKYKTLYKEISKDVDIRFVKVKGHSNNHYNDMVDTLAKRELGIKACSKKLESQVPDEIISGKYNL